MFSNLSDRLTAIIRSITGKTKISESNVKEMVDQIRISFIEADVPLEIINTFLEGVVAKAIGQKVVSSLKPGEVLTKIVHEELVHLLGSAVPLNLQARPPVTIMVAGLQGSGKTTTVAKLAYRLKNLQKKSILLTSVDIYRPAAMEQLQFLSEQVGANYFTPPNINCSPTEIAKVAVSYGTKILVDIVIIDTAGRLHIDAEMMDELREINKIINPQETLLVIDSMIGQDAINVAKKFNDYLAPTGIILTKTDGDSRGGAALAMRQITGQPIKFVGIGEKIDALEPFYPDRVASRILGMGDILSLVEDVYQKVDHHSAKALVQKLKKGKSFDLEDFRAQLRQMRSLGGLSGLMTKLPKLGNATQAIDDKILVKMEAIINSMTIRERCFPAFIKNSNRKRIALGSGTNLTDVNKLLRQFEQMQKMMQKINGSKIKNLLQRFKES